jgi:hypothetical protein
MVIVSLNMGNLNMEVSNMKNILATEEGKKKRYRRNWRRKGTSIRNINKIYKSRRSKGQRMNTRSEH